MNAPELIAEIVAQIRKGAEESNSVITWPVEINIDFDSRGISRGGSVSVQLTPRPPAPN